MFTKSIDVQHELTAAVADLLDVLDGLPYETQKFIADDIARHVERRFAE